MSDVGSIEHTPIKPRRSQMQRRTETVQRIMNAGIDVLIKKGYANLTTTDVAAISGFSRGAQLTYFSTKKDLIIGVARFALEESARLASAFADRAVVTSDILADFVDHVKLLCEGKPGVAMVEIVLAMRTDSELRNSLAELTLEYERRWHSIWQDVFVSRGYTVKQAETIVEITTHLMQGASLHACRRPDGDSPKVGDRWRELLVTAIPLPNLKLKL